MSITQEQITNITKNLSKLHIKNEKKLLNDINSILWYVELLQEVNTKWVKPTVSVINKKSKLKNDTIKKEMDPNLLLNCSNQKIIWNQIAIADIMK